VNAPRETIVMLDRAEDDLLAAQNMLDSETFTDRIFGFHAQQAVEKLFKAWLWYLDCSPPFTHNLASLLKLLIEAGAQCPDSFRRLCDLTDYAVIFRYSQDSIDDELDRAAVLADIEALSAHIRKLIS
jgi:HEPN domain-containing protein